MRLRDKAKFDVRDFNDVVVQTAGPLQLTLLATVVDDYVAAATKLK